MTPALEVALEVRRDVEHESESPAVHRRDDVAFGDRLRRLEVGCQKGARDAPRQFRTVFVDDRHRRVVHLLRTALRLRHDRQRERVDDQAQLRWTPIERQPEPLVKV